MNYEEARHQLLLHGSGATDANGEPVVAEDGFLGSLRPYRGLHEKNFHLVMEALLVVGERFRHEPQVDRKLITSIWYMCSLARDWGLQQGGMLQRNKLITASDTARLELWIEIVERVALGLLDGWPLHYAVTEYAGYIITSGWWANIDSFIPLMIRAVSDPKMETEPVVRALGKLGPLAKAALPALYEAEKREYTFYQPEQRCTQEMRDLIRDAIRMIERAN